MVSELGETEPGGLTQVPELPELHSEFRASLGYIERLCIYKTVGETEGLVPSLPAQSNHPGD